MARSAEWQCRNCGEHPSSFIGDTPCTKKCSRGGNHVWMRIPEGPSQPKYWQCLRCGAHPSSFVGSRPAPGSHCKGTGNKHVWVLI